MHITYCCHVALLFDDFLSVVFLVSVGWSCWWCNSTIQRVQRINGHCAPGQISFFVMKSGYDSVDMCGDADMLVFLLNVCMSVIWTLE